MKNTDQITYYLTCSYIEIYNEQIFDLLSDRKRMKTEILTVCEDAAGRGFYVKGLSEFAASSIEEVMEYISKGESNRHYAATAMNHHSSRSHTIFRLTITSIKTLSTKEIRGKIQESGTLSDSDNEEFTNEIMTESILNFVDLAGSERVANLSEMHNPLETVVGSGAESGRRVTPIKVSKYSRHKKNNKLDTLSNEGRHINVSLFYLCQVIKKLAMKSESAHIPYRNSNLTKLLRSSLGGNAKTCVICTATPTLSQYEMTASTLRFA
jgi:centromeric protein E